MGVTKVEYGGEVHGTIFDRDWEHLHRDVTEPSIYKRYRYQGTVVDVMDPLKLGRVRARVIEIHGSHLFGIPDEDLWWAVPTFQGGLQEVGSFEVPVVGSSVWVEFYLGDFECPMYTKGRFGLIDKEGLKESGDTLPIVKPAVDEKDPDPNNETPSIFRNYQPVTTRAKKGNDVVSIDSALVPHWYIKAEPRNPYHPDQEGYLEFTEDGLNEKVYPKNKGFKTESGIVVEADDENCRIHIWHPAGTYIEIDRAGQLIIKAEGDAHMTFAGDLSTHVKGNRLTEVDGDDVVKCVNHVTKCVRQTVECVDQDTHAAAAVNVVADAVSVDADTIKQHAHSSGELL